MKDLTVLSFWIIGFRYKMRERSLTFGGFFFTLKALLLCAVPLFRSSSSDLAADYKRTVPSTVQTQDQCYCHSAQNPRTKLYTQKSAKIGFTEPFCRFSPNFATDLLQTCYKRLKRGPPTHFIISMQKWIRFTFWCQKTRRHKKKPLTFSGKRPYVWWKGTPASTVSPVDIPTGLGPAH